MFNEILKIDYAKIVGNTFPFVVSNINGEIMHVNRLFLKLSGYETIDSLVGKDIKVLMPEDYARKHNGFLEYLDSKSVTTGMNRELPLKKKDGTIKQIVINLQMLKPGFFYDKILIASFLPKHV